MWTHCVAVAITAPYCRNPNNLFTGQICSGELADGTQEAPPTLPFRYPGNFICESVSYFGRCFSIPKRQNLGFVTHKFAALGTLWHRSRLLNCHSGFCAHCLVPPSPFKSSIDTSRSTRALRKRLHGIASATDAQLVHLVLKGCSFQSEALCRPAPAGYPARRAFQRIDNDLTFSLLEF